MKVLAKTILQTSRRFDLIFKYVYLRDRRKCPDFYRAFYLEHIRAFNGFDEVNPSDGKAKSGPLEFLQRFDGLEQSLVSGGFDAKRGLLPVSPSGEICDGAHRLACCALHGLEVETYPVSAEAPYDYRFFAMRGIDGKMADFAALEYVKLNPNAWIVNLHAVTDPSHDDEVEAILGTYGFVYYKKSLSVDFNGYVNLKKISYGTFWERETWIGTAEDGYPGAQMHARESMGPNPMRIYVFVCPDVEKVLAAKREIRTLFGKGNFSVHINDSHEEAVWLAETYFNDNSLKLISRRRFSFIDRPFDGLLEKFAEEIRARGLDRADFLCLATSVYGLRTSGDLDYVYAGRGGADFDDERLSDNLDECNFYPAGVYSMTYRPENYCWYHGFKFVTAENLLHIKRGRKKPHDADTCSLIKNMLCQETAWWRRLRRFAASFKRKRRRM